MFFFFLISFLFPKIYHQPAHTFLYLATDSPPTNPPLHKIVLEGYLKITILLNMHALMLYSSRKTFGYNNNNNNNNNNNQSINTLFILYIASLHLWDSFP
jgi:hypothetical protein